MAKPSTPPCIRLPSPNTALIARSSVAPALRSTAAEMFLIPWLIALGDLRISLAAAPPTIGTRPLPAASEMYSTNAEPRAQARAASILSRSPRTSASTSVPSCPLTLRSDQSSPLAIAMSGVVAIGPARNWSDPRTGASMNTRPKPSLSASLPVSNVENPLCAMFGAPPKSACSDWTRPRDRCSPT